MIGDSFLKLSVPTIKQQWSTHGICPWYRTERSLRGRIRNGQIRLSQTLEPMQIGLKVFQTCLPG
ncbi:hypothetical protein DJ93_6037 [Bacillus clarus]|uniref:Uncharacterized protein n=1 Tax=Bacillus clarus TaxID=2338372 RepID=A0A090Y9G8_9BACI|nr:hypothetical protein DJ93_6037 [Bacillus clarus]